jgi:hypothetical protein
MHSPRNTRFWDLTCGEANSGQGFNLTANTSLSRIHVDVGVGVAKVECLAVKYHHVRMNTREHPDNAVVSTDPAWPGYALPQGAGDWGGLSRRWKPSRLDC